jgi:hydroxyacylglutathione hydrolase
VPVSVLDYERRFNRALREALQGSESDFVKGILSGQPEPPLYFARMKRDNRHGPALLPDGHPFTPPRIDSTGLRSWIGSPTRVILDLRKDRAAFVSRHLPGSLFAPLPGGKLPVAAGSYVEENTEILLLAHDAAEAEEATRQLLRIGLDHVRGWLPVDEALSNDSLVTALPRIATAELPDAVVGSPDARVLDVRSADEFATSHVAGAQHVAYTRLADHLAEIPVDRPLYVHCGSGLRAALAVAFLAAKGRQAILVDGDFDDIPGPALA